MSEKRHRRRDEQARPRTHRGVAVGAETDALKQTIALFVPTNIRSGALFQELPTVSVAESALSQAFVDPTLSASIVESLAAQVPGRELAASAAISGSLALDAVRPLVKVQVPTGLANVGQQFSVISESLARLAEVVAPAQRIVAEAQALAETWRPFIVEAAASVEQFVEHQRDMDERTDEFVHRYGWPVPTSISSRGYRHIMSMVGRPKREVTGFMVRSFRPGTRAYADARDVIEQSSYFESRRPLLRQVWAAQRRGEWYLVINGLLPLVEGVLVDAVFPPKATRPKQGWTKGVERLRAGVDVPFGDAPLRAAETLLISGGAGLAMYEHYDPPPGVEPRGLNRHGVLHGGACRYGTEQNAVRLFLVLVLMAECFELLDISRQQSRRAKT